MGQTGRRKRNVMRALAVAVILAGAGARFYGLGRESLWNDEFSRLYRSTLVGALGGPAEVVATDVHPPTFYYMLHYLRKYFGESEVVLRMPSAVCGALAVLCMFHLAKRLYSENEALIATALFAFSWAPLHYSQDVGPYVMMLLLAILSSLILVGIIDRVYGNGRAPYGLVAAYVCVGTVHCYLHYFGLLLTALQGLGMLMLLALRKRGQTDAPGAVVSRLPFRLQLRVLAAL
ncbi:MAG TPA: hypothetical protein HPP83_12560, partial [Candidatus Hydrogenedentes bacterium]|nr:hypothetical protein [Candidatus Hydrogenedentota bacterium]